MDLLSLETLQLSTCSNEQLSFSKNGQMLASGKEDRMLVDNPIIDQQPQRGTNRGGRIPNASFSEQALKVSLSPLTQFRRLPGSYS
jgi:hypothetical protein